MSAFIDDGTATTIIWRLTARGGLDPTWGSGGVLTAPSTPVDALAVQSGTGRLVLAYGSEAFRLTPTGAFDTGFGVAGIASLPTTQIGQILPLPGGRIQLAGKSDTRLEVVRLRRNGTPDSGWSGDGRASYRPPVPADTTSYFVWPALTVILPTGEVIALAAVNQTTPASFDVPLTVVRFTSSGARDARFTPRHRIGFEAQNSRVALQVNGKILVVGRLAGSLDTGLLRLRPDGRPDRGFGSRGVLSVPDNSVTFGDVALQRSGRILLSGTQGTTWPDYTAFVRAYRGDAVVKCQGRWPTQMGTGGADVLRGTGARDVISGLGGRDTLVGLGGGDLLCGQAGDDVLRGGAGADVLVGGPGRDTLDGGPGPDRLIQ